MHPNLAKYWLHCLLSNLSSVMILHTRVSVIDLRATLEAYGPFRRKSTQNSSPPWYCFAGFLTLWVSCYYSNYWQCSCYWCAHFVATNDYWSNCYQEGPLTWTHPAVLASRETRRKSSSTQPHRYLCCHGHYWAHLATKAKSAVPCIHAFDFLAPF